MNSPSHPAPPATIRPRQFSLRSLFLLMLAVALLLTISYLCRGSYYFGALASPWALVALAPIVAVIVCHRWQLIASPTLATGSPLLYVISLALPAVNLGQDIVFGAIAAYCAFVGISMFEYWWTVPGWFAPSRDVQTWYPIAGTLGSLSNLAFVVAWLAWLFSRGRAKPIAWAHRTAVCGVMVASLAILSLALSGQLVEIYPGYGLWVASLLAIALAARH